MEEEEKVPEALVSDDRVVEDRAVEPAVVKVEASNRIFCDLAVWLPRLRLPVFTMAARNSWW